MKKIIKRTLAGVLIVLTLYLLTILTGANTKFSYRWVVSGSMEPTILTGGLVLLRAYDEDHMPQVNDIAVFRNEDIFGAKDIVHRIIYTDGQNVLTKGDHNQSSDGFVPVENVKYKVVKICNGTVGYYNLINNLDQDTWNIVLVVAEFITGVCILIIASEIISIKEEKENRKLLS